MYAAGADYVVLPRIETAQRLPRRCSTRSRTDALDDLRARALADLEKRDEVLA